MIVPQSGRILNARFGKMWCHEQACPRPGPRKLKVRRCWIEWKSLKQNEGT